MFCNAGVGERELSANVGDRKFDAMVEYIALKFGSVVTQVVVDLVKLVWESSSSPTFNVCK